MRHSRFSSQSKVTRMWKLSSHTLGCRRLAAAKRFSAAILLPSRQSQSIWGDSTCDESKPGREAWH